ncbi:MAG: hypothetical protein A2138_23170 [Deltaproteobacteria bacterium RBG_16_71_12]|nr:MAG: hypothetical protein A2138_23170 [Deltaproteobacteria bacterium RBG_16_71_12]
MGTADVAPSARTLRTVQLSLVAASVAGPALNGASWLLGLEPSLAPSVCWLIASALIAVFAVAAHRLACRLGQAPSMSAGTLVALTLIPCVSIVGIPCALRVLAKPFAALTGDDGLVRRTTVAAVLYPVIAVGIGTFVTMAIVAMMFPPGDGASFDPALMAVAFTLPSLAAQSCLAAATYFLTSAARHAVDLRRDLASAGRGGPAAVSV